jgi:hypothetical protein
LIMNFTIPSVASAFVDPAEDDARIDVLQHLPVDALDHLPDLEFAGGFRGRTLFNAAQPHLKRRLQQDNPDADRPEVLDRLDLQGLVGIRAEEWEVLVIPALEPGRRHVGAAGGYGCRQHSSRQHKPDSTRSVDHIR